MHSPRLTEGDNAMKKETIKKVEKELRYKIKHFQSFEKLTELLCGTDFDSLAELIAKRQVEISKIDKSTAALNAVIESLSSDESELIRDIINLKNINPSQELIMTSVLSKELAQLLDTVAQKDVLAKNRIDAIKDELTEQMHKSTKNKQVLDYFNSFANVSNNGSSFDSVM